MLRPATPADYEAFLRLFEELATGDPLPSRARFEAETMPGATVAEIGGEVVGYAFVEVLSDKGYLRHLAVDPRLRRQGVGRILMRAAMARFLAEGCPRFRLNVKVENDAARCLYESEGMIALYRSAVFRFNFDIVTRLPREAAEAGVVDPSEDVALEARFSLPAGQLARVRGLPGRVILCARQGGQAAAVACFDPAFPGAFPFRVSEVGLAAPLLDGCRERTAARTMQVVVEADPSLERALEDAGAERKLQLLHYEGPSEPGRRASSTAST